MAKKHYSPVTSPEDNPLYHDTYKLLRCYRDSTYSLKVAVRQVEIQFQLEFKQILDTIAAYVLVDDTGLFCDSYHTTELGTHDHTIVSIMDREAFPAWVKSRQRHIKTISEIS